MGMEFEKLKKNFQTDRSIPEKQGRVRGNKKIFKVDPSDSKVKCAIWAKLDSSKTLGLSSFNTCKNGEDLVKNEGTRASIHFLHYKSI